MASANASHDAPLTLGYIAAMETAAPNTSTSLSPLPGIVSDGVKAVFMVMNFVVLCGLITVLGTVANTVNILVFLRLGVKDPVNITLLALALSDWGSCFSLIWLTVCYNPLFQQLELPFDPADFHYLTSGWIHNFFTRVTSCFTAFITLERCLCVAAPLKVKAIITPGRVTAVLAGIVLFVLAAISPIFHTARYRWTFHPDRNRSLLSLVFLHNSQRVDAIAFPIHSIFIPIASFLVVLVSTAVLVINLRQKAKWRQKATSTSGAMSSRDTKISKMVVVVAILFIVCFIPVFISVTAMMIDPDFNVKGRYENLFLIMFSYHFALECLNSSLNIFIYYHMSSNYRAVFDQMFRRNKTTSDVVKVTS